MAILILGLLALTTACGGADQSVPMDSEGGGPSDKSIGEQGDEITASTTSLIEVRPTLTDIDIPDWTGEVVNLHELAPGTCFNSYAWVSNDRLVEIDTRVPCEGPHQNEIYLRTAHPARPGAPWPGDREMEAYAQAECYAAFVDFVGIIFELSTLELGYLTPSRADFEHDRAVFRNIHCFVHRSDNTDLIGTTAGSRL
tara:strand:- start:256 stop:849 length:594 start_codon:yes stop_codon:yes gene_type:complete